MHACCVSLWCWRCWQVESRLPALYAASSLACVRESKVARRCVVPGTISSESPEPNLRISGQTDEPHGRKKRLLRALLLVYSN